MEFNQEEKIVNPIFNLAININREEPRYEIQDKKDKMEDYQMEDVLEVM